MSSSITITFEPEAEGVRRGQWAAWAREHGLHLEPGNGMFYSGAGEARVEADYYSTHRTTFGTYHMGPGLAMVALLGVQFWAEFGGDLHASPELTRLVMLRVAGAGELIAALKSGNPGLFLEKIARFTDGRIV